MNLSPSYTIGVEAFRENDSAEVRASVVMRGGK